MQRKLTRCENELEFEKRLKAEAKEDRDESQKEAEELLAENENIKKRLKTQQNDFDELQLEHRDLVEEYKVMAEHASKEALQAKLLEAEDYLVKKFDEKMSEAVKEIERWQKQCEILVQKNLNCEKKLEKYSIDLKEAREEVANIESYRKQDISEKIKEKETLKDDLKAKKMKIQALQSSNEELTRNVSDLEKKIRDLERTKQASGDKKAEVMMLQFKLQDKSCLAEEFRKQTCDDLSLQNHMCKAISNGTGESENSKIHDENAALKRKLHLSEMENEATKDKFDMLKSKNKSFEEALKLSQKEKMELQTSLDGVSKEKSTFEESALKSNEDLRSKDQEILVLKDKLKDLANKKAKIVQTMQKQIEEWKHEIKLRIREKQDLETSIEGERHGMNERLGKALKTNASVEDKCNQLEAILSEKEVIIKHLQATVEEKMLSEKMADIEISKRKTLQEDLASSKGVSDELRAVVGRLERDLEMQRASSNELEKERSRILRELQKETQKNKVMEDSSKKLEKSIKDFANRNERKVETFQRQIEKCKYEIERRMQEKQGMEASFEEERCSMNEKLNEVLQANVNIEEECSQLRATLSENEVVIKHLQATVEGKMLNEAMVDIEISKRKTLQDDLALSKRVADELRAVVGRLERDLEMHRASSIELEKETSRFRKELQNETQRNKKLEDYARKLENSFSDSKKHSHMIGQRVSMLEEELNAKQYAAKVAKEQNSKLAVLIEELRNDVRQKEEMLVRGGNKRSKKLQGTAERLDLAKRTIEKLELDMGETAKLRRDLKSREEECQQSRARQNDLLMKLDETGQHCEDLERTLKESERKRKRSEEIRNSCEAKLGNIRKKHHEVAEDFQRVKNALLQLKINNSALGKENEELKRRLDATSRMSLTSSDMEDVKELKVKLDGTKVLVKEVQSHNFELKEKLNAERSEYKSLRDKMNTLKMEFEEYKRDSAKATKRDEFKVGLEYWQRKFDDLAAVSAKAKASMQIINENSSKLTEQLREEIDVLKGDLDRANFTLKEREKEVEVLKKRCRNHQEMSGAAERRNAEAMERDVHIEETEKENRKLVAEIRKLERLIRDLKKQIVAMENENDETKLEQGRHEWQQKERINKLSHLRSITREVQKAHEEIGILEDGNIRLEKDYKLLQNTIEPNRNSDESEDR